MATNKDVDRRLAHLALSHKDLTKEQLARAKKDLGGSHTGGFFSSDEYISLTLKRR